MVYATTGPTIPMEKTFAPSVVRPPCARKSDWYRRTIVPRTAVIAGPKRIAASPVPVGWEQLPVTIEGSFSADRTKMNAPATASRGSISRFSFTSLFNL